MVYLFSHQYRFVSKSLVFLTVIFLVGMPGLTRGQYLLDTFDDDPTGLPPNGPEIGSASYGGSATHSVVNYSGDLRLHSADSDTNGGISISYIPFASSDVVEVRYQILIESGASLAGQNAFTQQMILEPGGTNIHMDWTNTHEWAFRISTPGADPCTINTGLTWVENAYYIINWYIDTVNDTVRVEMFDGMANILGTTSISYKATAFNHMAFSTNYPTTGNQRINDVSIRRYCGGGPCTWYVDIDAVGDNNGQNWVDAFPKLQDALTVAQTGDEIWVAEGTYKPDQGFGYSTGDRTASFALKNGVEIYGGFDGTESIRDARDWQANETILSGEIGNGGITTDNSYHVVHSDNNDPTAILNGFTVTAGNANGGYPENFGGGMYIWSGSPTISNSIFKANQAANGGGLAALQAGSPSLFNCIFMANSAEGGAGGGGLNIQISSPILRSCMILGNSTTGDGGGMYTRNNELTTPTCSNCVFSGNTADGDGGAIHHGGAAVGFMPTELINCSLNENSASSDAGGVYNWGGDDLTLNSCILWANSDAGGSDELAQFTNSSGAPSIVYSCLQGWTGAWGGLGNIGTNPLFVDPHGLDAILGNLDDNLRLQLLSPCIDTGDPNPLLNDSDGSRNDMGAYGGPAADLGGIGVFPGSGFLFTTVGNIPRSEITQTTGDPCAPIGLANGGPITNYKNAAFAHKLHLHGLFGDLDEDVEYYQVLAGAWDGTTPPDPCDANDWVTLHDTLKKVLFTYNDVLGEWEHETITLGPQLIDGVPNLYQLTSTGFWSHIDKRIIWNTQNYPVGLYTLTVKAYDEVSPGNLDDITTSLGNIGSLVLHVDYSPVTATIHHVNYDPCNPYYVPADDGEIKECSIINLEDTNENLRFYITASHANGFLRQFTLDNIWGKNQNGGVIAQQVYPDPPPALWYGVTDVEFESKNAPNPPGNLQSWRRCAYQFRLRVWPRMTNGYGYLGHREFSDHYFLDLPGVPDCSVYDSNNDNFINLVDFAAFLQYWGTSCSVE